MTPMSPQASEVKDDERTEDAEEELADIAARARADIEEFVRDSPHAALGIAAIAGFVLGGGLTPRRLLRLGLSIGGPTLTQKLTSHAADLLAETLSRRPGAERAEHH
jgi:hypothetical protein